MREFPFTLVRRNGFAAKVHWIFNTSQGTSLNFRFFSEHTDNFLFIELKSWHCMPNMNIHSEHRLLVHCNAGFSMGIIKLGSERKF